MFILCGGHIRRAPQIYALREASRVFLHHKTKQN